MRSIEKKKNLHMVFINLEKVYDRFLEILFGEFWRERVTRGYIDVIKGMYDGAVSTIRSLAGRRVNSQLQEDYTRCLL